MENLSDISVGVIYDLEGDRSTDLVYFSWLDDNGFLVEGEIWGANDRVELICTNFKKTGDKIHGNK